MGIEDLRTLKTVGKVVAKNADEAATAAKVVDKAADVIVEMKGIEYTFPPGTDPVLARRIVWTKVMKPQVQGQEVKITLPSTLTGPEWDPAGMGSVPVTNEDFKYLGGFERNMTPSKFLSHAHKEPNLLTDTNAQSLRQGLKEGKKMAPPALWAKWDENEKVWRVTSHEGRHRSALVKEQYGDVEMPVRILPTDEYGNYLRGKVSDEMRKAPIVGVGSVPLVIGNIDVEKQPQIKNPDGSISTIDSFSVNMDGVEVLLTQIHPDGYRMTPQQAIEYYKKTGKHLGKFKTPEEATEYAKKLHESEAERIKAKPKTEPKKLEPGIYEDTDTGKYFKIDKDGNMTEYNQDETP